MALVLNFSTNLPMWNPRFAHAEPTPAGFTIYANIQKYDRTKKRSTPRAKMIEIGPRLNRLIVLFAFLNLNGVLEL